MRPSKPLQAPMALLCFQCLARNPLRWHRPSTVVSRKESALLARGKHESDASSPSTATEPPNWRKQYAKIRQIRSLGRIADVDANGASALAEEGSGLPKELRFQVLLSAMLSSQTRDAATSEAMRRLRHLCAPEALSAEFLLKILPQEVEKAISTASFFRVKAKNIAAVSRICQDKFNGDIPVDVEGLLALPGVGPKMAYLVMDVAWDNCVGICVDTHVHRISNRLGWVKTWNTKNSKAQDPEKTRKALQAWMPQEIWSEINSLLIGFGQTTCRPVGPRCSECGVRELCPSAAAAGSLVAPPLPPLLLPEEPPAAAGDNFG